MFDMRPKLATLPNAGETRKECTAAAAAEVRRRMLDSAIEEFAFPHIYLIVCSRFPCLPAWLSIFAIENGNWNVSDGHGAFLCTSNTFLSLFLSVSLTHIHSKYLFSPANCL
jgi:hypothetical protein